MTLHPATEAALASPRYGFFVAVELTLPGHTVRWVDGAGELEIDGYLFSGEDVIGGTISDVDAIETGAGDTAPSMSLTFLPPSENAAAVLADPLVQGSRIRAISGVYSADTGTVVGEPIVPFDGEIDVPTLRLGEHLLAVEMSCVPASERLFEADEGIRMSDSFHQSVWPGELGMAHATGITNNDYWGHNPPNPGISYTGNYLSVFGGVSP